MKKGIICFFILLSLIFCFSNVKDSQASCSDIWDKICNKEFNIKGLDSDSYLVYFNSSAFGPCPSGTCWFTYPDKNGNIATLIVRYTTETIFELDFLTIYDLEKNFEDLYFLIIGEDLWNIPAQPLTLTPVKE
jgi:hypothetical protein